MAGPALRTDIIDVYVFRAGARATTGPAFLQLRRTVPPMAGSWQPVMGHVEPGETAADAALRELAEETGYRPGHGLVGLWQLELVNTFYLAASDEVYLCPGFAAQVDAAIEPVLDNAHDAHRWVKRDHADREFLWPGQRAAIEHIVRDMVQPDSPMAPRLKVSIASSSTKGELR
ncbi:MAG: NUDIX domain-containing protein [Phycisphaeraceae bacterium]